MLWKCVWWWFVGLICKLYFVVRLNCKGFILWWFRNFMLVLNCVNCVDVWVWCKRCLLKSLGCFCFIWIRWRIIIVWFWWVLFWVLFRNLVLMWLNCNWGMRYVWFLICVKFWLILCLWVLNCFCLICGLWFWMCLVWFVFCWNCMLFIGKFMNDL